MNMRELARYMIENRHEDFDCKELAKHYLALDDVFKDIADRFYEPNDWWDVNFSRNDVDIWLYSDRFGNVYVTLTFEQIKKIQEQIEKGP